MKKFYVKASSDSVQLLVKYLDIDDPYMLVRQARVTRPTLIDALHVTVEHLNMKDYDLEEMFEYEDVTADEIIERINDLNGDSSVSFSVIVELTNETDGTCYLDNLDPDVKTW